MMILSHRALIDLLSPLEIVAAVEEALRAQSAQIVIMPKRSHVDWDGNTLLCMPAVGGEVCGVKLVSVVPGNASRNLPVTNGIMVLNDRATGMPRAAMNAAALTAQRTGAVGALGVKYMTAESTSSIGIIGCGVQGAWQTVFACAVRPVREIFCLARSTSRLEAFIATVKPRVAHVQITPCSDVRELLARTEVIITATTSNVPVLPDEQQLLENKHFISVGSYRPTMQELPDSVYRLCGALAVDSEHARHEVGDVINPLCCGILQEADVYSIAECVTGRRSVDSGSTTAYKSVGAALYDLYVASALERAARARNAGVEIEL